MPDVVRGRNYASHMLRSALPQASRFLPCQIVGQHHLHELGLRNSLHFEARRRPAFLPLETRLLITMSTPSSSIVEGVFAVNKPPSISSAQVIRNLQHVFNPSNLFAPWLEHERAIRNRETHYDRKRRKDKRVQVKMGHGGTLDPMATGVLIMGVGKGTKQLQCFLECSKTYEATVLFGAATDTYDTLGMILRTAPYDHVRRSTVDKALQKFRGKIMQRPPIYSALRMDGKRLYEYAREGKEVPKAIEKRSVEVKELEIVEWLERGTHNYRLPTEDAQPESKEVAEKVLQFGEATSNPATSGISATEGKRVSSLAKRKRSDNIETEVFTNKKPFHAQADTGRETPVSEAPHGADGGNRKPSHNDTPNAGLYSQSSPPALELGGKSPPAARLRMTVTSGFYVRSLAHDLGEAVGSLACLSALVRTRQGGYELGRNVLDYNDIGKGEEIWGPKVEALITAGKSNEAIAPVEGAAEDQAQGGTIEHEAAQGTSV